MSTRWLKLYPESFISYFMVEPERSPVTSKKTSKGAHKPGAKLAKKPKPSNVDRLQKQVQALKSSLSELEDRHLRLMAEFENYRKRKEREIARLLRYEGEEVIRKFLPVVDDLERIVQSADGTESNNIDSIIEGVNLIVTKLMKRLKDLEVEPFESVDRIFDPEVHEAVMTEMSDKHKDHQITKEFEKGYIYKDRVIRHAKVVVNSSPEGKSG